MWTLLVAGALGGDLLTSVDPPVSLAVGGNWARILPEEDGWSFFWAAGGDYNRLPMGDDLVVVDRDRTLLTGRTDLVDHALTRCPDGTILHAASANLESPNDSAFAFRYTADLTRAAEATVEERRGDVAHNDLPVLCGGPDRDLLAFGAGSAWWLGPDLSLTADQIEGAAQMQGSSMRWEGDTLVHYGIDYRGPLSIRRYDADLTPLGGTDLDLAEPGHTIWWPQANLAVGQYTIVAYMTRADAETWVADSGNVHLVVLEGDAVVQTLAATDLPPGQGAMRPGLARKDDVLLLSYDVGIVPTVVRLGLDLSDVVYPDTGEAGTDAGAACGCGVDGRRAGPGGLLVTAAVLVARTRRTRRRPTGGTACPAAGGWKGHRGV